jgi:hypothetical protein
MLTQSMQMRLVILISLAILTWTIGTAQPCQRLDIPAKNQQKILKRFIRQCKRKGFMTADSGYIYLGEWVDKEGQLNWQVAAIRHWQPYPWIAPFSSHCNQCIAPVGWTKVANRLVLRYRYDVPDHTLTRVETNCLQQLLAPYARILPPLPIPPKMVPWLDAQGRPILNKDGKPKMREYYPPVTAGSSGGNNSHITFKKDGSVEQGLSL